MQVVHSVVSGHPVLPNADYIISKDQRKSNSCCVNSSRFFVIHFPFFRIKKYSSDISLFRSFSMIFDWHLRPVPFRDPDHQCGDRHPAQTRGYQFQRKPPDCLTALTSPCSTTFSRIFTLRLTWDKMDNCTRFSYIRVYGCACMRLTIIRNRLIINRKSCPVRPATAS